MFDKRIAVSADREDLNQIQRAWVHTYSRSGSTVTALGLAEGFLHSTSIAIANQWLLVGSPFDEACTSVEICIGEANVFDLSRFTQ